MKEFEYPFDPEYLIKKRKSLKKSFQNLDPDGFIKIKIAILGGETTQIITQILELFLLNYGIKPQFYESEYNMWYEDGRFQSKELELFAPDIIYICTCIRNIKSFPELGESQEKVNDKLAQVVGQFSEVWNHIAETYSCTIIQNNFEYPFYRLMGNKDASDIHGKVNFITRLNSEFYTHAQTYDNFYICDVNYISASYGLDKWSDPFYWHMYKCAVAVPAIPYLSFNIANIIKSIYGKNKKAFNLDLDNTLWGGNVGDDGADNIEIGKESSVAQIYSEFQEYLKLHEQLGILLTINSKNDEANALSGLARQDSILQADDFVNIKANWKPKNVNLTETAQEMSLLPESFVFVDDNPAEREIVRSQIPSAAVAEIVSPEHYIQAIDKAGYFEVTVLSDDDLNRNTMYLENMKRNSVQSGFFNYRDYLKSLAMKAEIGEFTSAYILRIAQLTNKTNQFNLTTKRYSKHEIEEIAENNNYITLCGKLGDKFGDNGIVSVIIGRIRGGKCDELHIELWLMSCRVLKRDMEFAMMDELIKKARTRGIKTIKGYYYPTAKNAMVKDFYADQGFAKILEDEEGNTIWELKITEDYKLKNTVIDVNQ